MILLSFFSQSSVANCSQRSYGAMMIQLRNSRCKSRQVLLLLVISISWLYLITKCISFVHAHSKKRNKTKNKNNDDNTNNNNDDDQYDYLPLIKNSRKNNNQNNGNNDNYNQPLMPMKDHDTRNDCRSLLQYCQSDIFSHVYFECPESCNRYLKGPGMIGIASNPDDFYNFDNLRIRKNGKRIDSERFEGSVTIIAVLPLLPGIAAYFYEVLHHVHAIFYPKVEIAIVPLDVESGIHIVEHDNDNNNNNMGGKINKKSSVLVLEEETSLDIPILKYLSTIQPKSGGVTQDFDGTLRQEDISPNRATMFIVSADGKYIERLVSPPVKTIISRTTLFLNSMDYDSLLFTKRKNNNNDNNQEVNNDNNQEDIINNNYNEDSDKNEL